MKRLAGLVVLLLAGCAAPPAATTGPAGVPSASPSASATVHVRDQSLLKLPLGTVVDLDSATVAVLADEGAQTVDGKRLWAVRVRVCVSRDYMESRLGVKYKWYASDAAGKQVDAEDPPDTADASDPYGETTVAPGQCAGGSVYFPTSHPSRIWYSGASGMVGWSLAD